MPKFTLRKRTRAERESWSMIDEAVTEKSARTDRSKMQLAHPGSAIVILNPPLSCSPIIMEPIKSSSGI